MKKKPLIETNKYLKDPGTRKKILIRNAIASAKIEGIAVTKEIITLLNSEDSNLVSVSSKRSANRKK